MKKILLLVAIATLGLASCTDNQVEENLASKPISFNSMIGKNSNLKVAELLDANFNAFKVSAYFTGTTSMGTAVSLENYISNLDVTKSGSIWNYSDDYYWPMTGNLQFFAYQGTLDAALATTYTGYPTFNYTIKPIATQEDLIVAAAIDKTISVPTIAFNFNHALAQINFSVKGDKNNLNYIIKKIEIKNVINKGQFKYGADFAAASWVPSVISTDTNNYVYYNNTTGTTVTNSGFVSFGDGNPLNTALMLMPQTNSNIKIEVTYDVKRGTAFVKTGSVATVTLPSTTWNKGSKVRYNLTVPVNGTRIEFSATVAAWGAEQSL